MAEDKDEGEVQRASGGSSVEEGHFSNGLDDQISTIEDQLKRAEATLFDLQSLRGKLEAERQNNILRAKEEEEIRESENIRKENERLRRELKEYHTEIGSLKEVISSLKDDLVKTAEKLETKVTRTLNSLPEEKSEHETHKHKTEHHAHHQHHKEAHDHNFFSDHLSPLTEKKEVSDKAVAPEIKHSELEASQEEAPEKINEMPKESTEAAAPPKLENAEPDAQTAPAEQAVPPQANAAQSEAAPNSSMAEHLLNDPSEPHQIKAAVVTELQNSTEQVEADVLASQELNEYEEIKRELLALENEAMFKPTHSEASPPVAQPEVKSEPNATSAEKESKPNFVAKLFQRKEKEEESEPAVGNQLAADQAAAQAQATEANNKEAAPPEATVISAKTEAVTAPPEAAGVSTAAEAVSATPETVHDNPQQPSPEKTEVPEAPAPVSSPIAESTPVPEEIVAEPKAKKTSFSNIFKNKKKKVKGRINDGREDNPHSRHPSGGGKIAIAAAAAIILVVGIGLFFKIRNAEQLRQIYISKATENVATASENSNKSEVPDEFANLDPEKKYKEAYADLPFDQSAWATYSDPDLGITIQYPNNTSYRLKPVGSANIWFLRKNGYLLKIEKLPGQQSLGEVRDGITTNVKYKSEDAIVRGNSTIHLILEDDLPVKGNIYLTSFNGAIYKIWYKTYAPGENPDDEQRVKKMLDSLDFIPVR